MTEHHTDPMTEPRRPTPRYDYLRDGDEIYRRSFATIRLEGDLMACRRLATASVGEPQHLPAIGRLP